jgi:hypothetical protein
VEAHSAATGERRRGRPGRQRRGAVVVWRSASGGAVRGDTAVSRVVQPARIRPAAFDSGGRSAPAGNGVGGSCEAARRAAVEIFFIFYLASYFMGAL